MRRRLHQGKGQKRPHEGRAQLCLRAWQLQACMHFNVTLWHTQWCPHGRLPWQSLFFQQFMFLPVKCPGSFQSTWHEPLECSELREKNSALLPSLLPYESEVTVWPQMTPNCSRRNPVPSAAVSNVQSRKLFLDSALFNVAAFWNCLRATHFVTSMGNNAKSQTLHPFRSCGLALSPETTWPHCCCAL